MSDLLCVCCSLHLRLGDVNGHESLHGEERLGERTSLPLCLMIKCWP